MTGATWRDGVGKWEVRVEDLTSGQVFTDQGEVLINAGGFLNTWKWPDIEGIETFRGHLVHSADWDGTYSFEGKRTAIIGSGSSAIQIVPKLQPGNPRSSLL